MLMSVIEKNQDGIRLENVCLQFKELRIYYL